MAVAISAHHHRMVEIEERRVHAVEHVLFHPARGSIVSITSQSLQELEPEHGAMIGEAVFDLAFLSDKPTGGPGARLLEHLVPVGAHHVAGVFQSRCLVVWNLRDAVLQSVTELEKQQKSVAALAGSLCKDKWLFYASEGSNSIKVSAVDAKDPPKKISRKAANRSSQLSALAYHSPMRVLAAGATDGALQLWTFSEDNALGGGAKDEAAIVTPLFAAQTTHAPVVQLSFASCGQSASLLLVAYQNRVVEVWDLVPQLTATRQRDPFRVAVLHCLPPQAMDFAKKNGELALHLHAQAPLLLIHWHAYNGAGSSVAAVEIRLGVGGAASPTPVPVSDWHELIQTAPPSHEDGSACLVYEANRAPLASPFMAYHSTHRHRQLLPLSVTSGQVRAAAEETTWLALSTTFQLSLDQYFKYQDVPLTVLQVTRNVEASTPQSVVFQLQRYSLVSGEIEKLDDLPVWTNYQGRQLLPWKLRWNEQQSALCIQLCDPTKPIMTTGDDANGGFTYVILEIKAKPLAEGDADPDGVGSGSSASVRYGSPMDALDLSFCDLRSDEIRENRPFMAVVLASSGKSIGFQSNCDQLDQDARVLLLQPPVQRFFPTPIALSSTSLYASQVGSRLLYLLDAQLVVLSEDDLSVPRSPASLGFKTRSIDERVVDVVWNTGAASAALTLASGTGCADTTNTKHLVAVRTTQRVVVLAAAASCGPSLSLSLSLVAEYELTSDLGSPQSLLWMAQTLLFVTSDQQLRFVTPLVEPKRGRSRSQLLCSLPAQTVAPQKVELVGVCSDRLCFTVQDPRNLECKTFLRPLAVCEPLLLGFAEPSDGRLRAIFERDFLVFLATGGPETRNPVTDRLLDTLYHDFGWTDTVTRVLNVLVNPSSAGTSATGGAGAGGGGASGGGGGGGSYKRFAHLSPTHVASLLLHACKWRDAVRVFLAFDPALEEYALADGELGASSAKLPSRTGATAAQFQWLGHVLVRMGQPELALMCLDVAGDDLAIVGLLRTHGLDRREAEPVLAALQKDWAKLNPPLAAITKAATMGTMSTTTGRRHDLLALLCCDQLAQTERRSRLLSAVRPLEKLTLASALKPTVAQRQLPVASAGRAGVLYWKRLSPEDAKDAVGVSVTPHFSADEPKQPPSYALFHATTPGGGVSLGLGAIDDPASGSSAQTGPGGGSSSSDTAAKITIGPFLEDEDAVVAYWRFEEGANANANGNANEDDTTTRTLESADTTKRENHLQILQWGAAMALVTSNAPVDKGEDGKLQEAFSLRFPRSSPESNDGAKDVNEWGAKCAVRAGSTLDVGWVFDEDPYRRKLTFEAWVRNHTLAEQLQQQQQQSSTEEDDDDANESSAPTPTTPIPMGDGAPLRRFVTRRGLDKATWWEFGLCDGGVLFLTFGSHTLRADDKLANAGAAWQHVAFSVDITSPKHAVLKLFAQAKCVAVKEITGVDANNKLVAEANKAVASATGSSLPLPLPPPPSTLYLGLGLADYEMAEVRVWATARTPEQLSDMKENYLGIAETKRRMKITIHQRNCQCEKCLGRRTAAKPLGGAGADGKAAGGGIATRSLLGAPLFPSTPPPASSRDRRRPPPKK